MRILLDAAPECFISTCWDTNTLMSLND